MNYIDYIIISIILIGFVLGFKDGLVRKIIGLIGLILGIALAFEYSDELGKLLMPFFNDDFYLSEIVAGIIIFVSTIFIASVIKRIIHPLDKVNKFLNQMLGGLAGVIQIVFFISGFLLFLNIFNFPKSSDRENSMLYNSVSLVVPTTIDYILGANSQTKNFIKDYIESKDKFSLPTEIDTTIIEN